jgi:hypothetical protein
VFKSESPGGKFGTTFAQKGLMHAKCMLQYAKYSETRTGEESRAIGRWGGEFWWAKVDKWEINQHF